MAHRLTLKGGMGPRHLPFFKGGLDLLLILLGALAAALFYHPLPS